MDLAVNEEHPEQLEKMVLQENLVLQEMPVLPVIPVALVKMVCQESMVNLVHVVHLVQR
jgi:hypothetical protein